MGLISCTIDAEDGGNGMVKIDIGSGDPRTNEKQADGFLRQDIEPYEGIDLVCDIRDLDKHVEAGSCEHLRASHVLEHFGTKEVDEVIAMIYKLLCKGGIFEIYVPNFKWHSKLVMEGEHEKAVYYCFGGQLDDWDYHKTGFTTYILEKKLTEAGFKIQSIDDDSSISCIAIK